MKIDDIINDYPLLTENYIRKGFDNLKYKLTLAPIIIGGYAFNMINKPIVDNRGYINIDNALYELKDIKDIECEERSYDISEFTYDEHYQSSLNFIFRPYMPSGKLYLFNSIIAANEAYFNLIVHLCPQIIDDEIPQGLLLPTLAYAMYEYNKDIQDLASASRYEAIALNLINYLNRYTTQLMPTNWSKIGDIITYDL